MNRLGKFTALCALTFAALTTTSCDSIFHDDLADCPQGVYVRFYQQSPCFSTQTNVGNVNNLYLLAFDKNTGLLANFVKTDNNINLSPDHETLLPLHQGEYELVAWTGNAAELASGQLQNGVTRKSDLFFQLRQQTANGNNTAALSFPNTPEPIRYGFAGTGLRRQPADSAEVAHYNATSQLPEDAVISIPDPAKEGSVFRHAAINLRPQALNVKVRLILDSKVKTSRYPTTAGNFSVSLLTAANGLLHNAVAPNNVVDWQVPQAQLATSATLQGLAPVAQRAATDTLALDYNVLGNTLGNLANGRLELSHQGQRVVLSDNVARITQQLNLPALIRLAAEKQNLNLSCKPEVTIDLHVRNQCDDCNTYMVFDVVIGPWSVHSYEVEL